MLSVVHNCNFIGTLTKFGRVCKRRKLRVNVGKSKVMRCSWYGNRDRMHVILNGEPLEEVDCFKYLGLQVAADRGCGTQNEIKPREEKVLTSER